MKKLALIMGLIIFGSQLQASILYDDGDWKMSSDDTGAQIRIRSLPYDVDVVRAGVSATGREGFLHINARANDGRAALRLLQSGKSKWAWISDYPEEKRSSFYSYSGNANVLTLTEAAKVGINNVVPKYQLSVSGETFAETLYIGENEAAIKASITANGDATFESLVLGAESSEHKLHVEGTAYAKEFVSEVSSWADFVFEDDYNLMPLAELERFVKVNKHLPAMPPQEDLLGTAVNVTDLQSKLLQAVEENVLYILSLQKELEAVKVELESLKRQSP